MPSIRHQYAKRILEEYQKSFNITPNIHHIEQRVNDVPKIGIIGAGITGLYIALMLDWLGNSGFEYDLLEANPDVTRVGGRMFTYHFSEDEFDYCDVGAMRFPKLEWMQPAFDLMTYLGITPESGLLIPYVLSTNNNISFFNGVPLTEMDVNNSYDKKCYDPFLTHLTGLDRRPKDFVEDRIGPIKKQLTDNWEIGWESLMRFDNWSMREYMSFTEPGLPQSVISYLETMGSITGLYDCALSESVLGSLDFDYPNTEWFCVAGGADIIPQRALQKLSQPVQRGKRVTAIVPFTPSGGQTISSVELTINGAEKTNYDHVISTMPLSCLSVVDTSKCGFDWLTTSAIRQLRYDGTVKVAIKFSERWWEKLPVKQVGGASSTDRPIRTVVYPSYGVGSSAAVMIVSYTWCQDSSRIGSFLRGTNSKAPKDLLDVILRDLTDMHGIRDTDGNIDYNFLVNLMVDNHAWDWYANEYSMGGHALFGPGQFTSLYPKVTQPTFGRLHLAGEATSVHHTWITGALNSAFRSLVQVFLVHNRRDLIDRLLADGSPFKSAGQFEFTLDLIEKQIALGQAHGRKLAELN